MRTLALFLLAFTVSSCDSGPSRPDPQKNPQGAVSCKQGDTVYYWNTGNLYKVNCGEQVAYPVVF